MNNQSKKPSSGTVPLLSAPPSPPRPNVSQAPTAPPTPAHGDPTLSALTSPTSATAAARVATAAATSGSSSEISPVPTPPLVERTPLNLTAVSRSLSGGVNQLAAEEAKAAEEEEEKFDREELMITDEELYFVEVLEIYTKTPEEIPEEKYKEAINYFKDDEFDIFCRIIGLSTENMDDFNELWKTFYEYDKNGFTTILAGTNSDIIVDSFIKLIDQVPSVIYDIKILNNLNKILPEDNTFPKHNKCPSVEIFDADINYYHMFKLLEIISENNR